MFWTAVTVSGVVFAVARLITLMRDTELLSLNDGIPFRENSIFFDLPILEEYDFLVIGSGPSGSVLANRLSEVGGFTVLLLEKGMEGNIQNDIPLLNQYTILGPCSRILPVENEPGVCAGLESGRCHWPSGHCVGGASQLNAMIMTRGRPSDYDKWASDGNPGWSFEELLPYFLKFENMSIGSLAESEYHATGGPVHIEYPFQSEVGRRFLKAGQELGYDIIDYNNPNTVTGFSATQVTEDRGKRHSAVSAYLLPARKRKNLHIAKDTFVTKVLIDSDTKKAYGVIFVKQNKERTVLVRNEVIVSAGAFGSPQLLMLSGIGPKKHLEEMGIPLIQDLPVGNNLQEHLGTPAVTFLINTTDSFTLPKIGGSLPLHFLQWFTGGGGVLASNAAEALAYIKTPLEGEKPDIELIFAPIQIGGHGGILGKTLFISDEVYAKTWEPIVFREGFFIAPMGMYPRSRGTVRLRSTDPNDPPLIDSNFFSDQHDVDVIIEGVRAAIQVASTRTFREIGSRLHDIPVAGCEMFPFNSDEYWNCTIRRIPIQFHHQCGTCRMGPNPESAVVDPRLRVHGVQGLRVADASIMPYMPGIHTMGPCYMIGEKAADLIKEDWDIPNS